MTVEIYCKWVQYFLCWLNTKKRKVQNIKKRKVLLCVDVFPVHQTYLKQIKLIKLYTSYLHQKFNNGSGNNKVLQTILLQKDINEDD